MYCPKCGKELSDSVVYCSACGTKISDYLSSEEGADTPILSDNPEHNEKTCQDDIKEKAVRDVKERIQILANSQKKGTADQTGRGADSFYFVDFIKRLFGVRENLPLCIYLLMNIVFIGLIATAALGGNLFAGMLAGLILYIISMSFALSRYGENMLRARTGCVSIEETEFGDRLSPLFKEVYENARKKDPGLPGDIKLFVNDDESPNAFATGRRTVCVTRGMLSMSDEQIKGALGHEFGHLSHLDTDRVLVISLGNIFVIAFCALMHAGAYVMEAIMHVVSRYFGADNILTRGMIRINTILTIRLVDLFLALWTGAGALLCMKTSRGNEYQADAFSCGLGYGDGLIAVLQDLGESPKPTGLFATLAASHPPMEERIARIRELAASE